MDEVVVVGLGPVGSLLSLLLAEAGQKVLVLERSAEPVALPRAVALDGEAMRTFQRVGLADKVSAILQPSREPDEVCFANSKREKLFGSQLPDCGPNGWRDLAFFDQPELEALLRAEIAKRDRIEVRMGCEVTALENSEHSVQLRCRSTRDEAQSVIEAHYVLGCDGASSLIRSASGIGWKSLGYDQDWLVVDIVIRPEAVLPLSTMQVCDPNRLATYVCVKDPNRRWEFQMLPGETREEMLEPQRIQELLDPWLPVEHYSIRRSAVYQFHAATAEAWRKDRVLLVGDAAHQTPPFLGQGLNTGIRDAANLAWKLTRVLRRECPDRLLASY
ncbi:bifunctional 3-(3-hydroxy-phenyl)propionate/3-hydroxycinnamic acid hydroxylase, partial [Myxococcota bacterium]|nr:bifunctional 3-(3-hydroxy-phenyl)propionate/3-hydroxycinnamic acid hydroxylase [Myxococcota bacterium]